MKKPDTLEYNWPETGRLEILMHGMHSATLRFTPSEAAIQEGLAKAAKRPTWGEGSEASSNTPEE